MNAIIVTIKSSISVDINYNYDCGVRSMSALAKRSTDDLTSLNTGRDRRQYQRIGLILTGRFLYEGDEYSLQTTDISCGGATIISAEQPPIDARIVCYFDNLGRVNAHIVRHSEAGFSVAFDASARKRDKLADQLIWLLNADSMTLPEAREADRKLEASAALVEREDGTTLHCRLLDISFTGASFESQNGLPMVGEFVSAGKLYGEVVRVTPGEFAIRFVHEPKEEIGDA